MVWRDEAVVGGKQVQCVPFDPAFVLPALSPLNILLICMQQQQSTDTLHLILNRATHADTWQIRAHTHATT